MEILKANIKDLDEILDIFSYAREFMVKNNNPNQWAKKNHPSKEFVIDKLNNNEFYKIVDSGKILGVFILKFGIDETYIEIDGKWLNDLDYCVIHSLAKAKDAKGIFNIVDTFAKSLSDNVRIDTHKDNLIMQNLIKKHGYKYCGIIHLNDNERSERLAYHYCKGE